MLKLEGSSLFLKCLKLAVHFRIAIKNQKKLFVSEITAFEIVAGNLLYWDGNTCNQHGTTITECFHKSGISRVGKSLSWSHLKS